MRLLAPALAEVMAVYEQGKLRIVSLDILKEFSGENNMHGLPSDPPHPAFLGGDEITEIPSSELEKPITAGVKDQERQSDESERDPGDRRETAGQTEQQVIRQTDHKTQITFNCEKEGGEPPPLDLDGEVEMQGGDSGEAEAQHNNRLEGIDEPPWPTLTRENEIKIQERAGRGRAEDVENEVNMQEEGVTGEKRGPPECGESSGNGKLQRREGIKRSLWDITPVSYEEYDDNWDLEDQSKKSKRAAICLLASCE